MDASVKPIKPIKPESERALLALAREAVRAVLARDTTPGRPDVPDDWLDSPSGAFVTWRHAQTNALRGCIGHLEATRPLWRTVREVAVLSATHDRRFPPVTAGELPALSAEISVLTPIVPCPDPAAIEIGVHGLLLRHGAASGVLLPQVPAEHGWDREAFLQAVSQKAGLARKAWRDPCSRLYWFSAQVLHDSAGPDGSRRQETAR